MKSLTTVLLACILVLGCSPREDKSAGGVHQAATQENADSVNPSTPSDRAWALRVLADSSSWPAVSREPVRPSPHAYAFCVAALTPTDLGPHNTPGYHVAVNPAARAGFESLPYRFEPDPAPVPFPVGTTVVKEKYADLADAEARTRRDAIGVMIKREAGYNPEHGDWEYGYVDFDDNGSIIKAQRGKLATCIDCHDNASARDYVYRTYPVVSEDAK